MPQRKTASSRNQNHQPLSGLDLLTLRQLAEAEDTGDFAPQMDDDHFARLQRAGLLAIDGRGLVHVTARGRESAGSASFI